jgi:ATP phosphoribosyltransferase
MQGAALRGRRKVTIKMNVTAGQLDAAVALLPSLRAPTVGGLYTLMMGVRRKHRRRR